MNANFIFLLRFSRLPSLPSSLEDFKQALKEDQNAGLQVADVDAEAVQQLLFPGAVSAVLVFHEGIDPFCLDCPTIIARRDGAW